MKKFIFTLLFTLFLSACSSNNVNINNNLYSDGEILAKTLYERTESNNYKMDKDTDNLFNKFEAKYDMLNDKWSDEEKDYLYTISRLKTAYLENHLEQTEDHLSEFYNNIEKLKTEYGVNF